MCLEPSVDKYLRENRRDGRGGRKVSDEFGVSPVDEPAPVHVRRMELRVEGSWDSQDGNMQSSVHEM